VEDNGKGFDYYNRCTKKGAGLINICNRVHYLKGKIDFKSAPGKGTSIYIELNT